MKNINVLITGTGRRVELIKAFREAALLLDINLKIFGTDINGTAPALLYCDFIRLVCGMKEDNYIDELLAICKKDSINIIIPTIDTDLLVLSENKDRFENIGVKVLISDKDKILICRDKNNTSYFFEECGLKAPKTYNNYKNYNEIFPCFIKPKDGSSSINAFKINKKDELELYTSKVKDYIIQPFINGKEYTIDVFCDFKGNPIYITPRERISVRAGEVLKTEIIDDNKMIQESIAICKKFKPCGPITVQLIREEKSNDDYFIEINPRFGGGAPLSMKSGAKSCVALFKLLQGEVLEYNNLVNSNIIYSRFDDSICISNKNINKVSGIIFDLDDTLYSEKEYIKSGYNEISKYLNRPDAKEKLWKYFLEDKQAIDEYLNEINKTDIKDLCIDLYRNHLPNIKLYDNVIELLNYLKNNKIKIGVITDGRPIGQRNKIKSLGLESLVDDIIVTDELGGIQFRKPNDISFRIMQNRWKLPFEEILYVGDNPIKDFQAPLQLGMKALYFKNKNGLYSSNYINFIEIIDKLTDIYKYIK